MDEATEATGMELGVQPLDVIMEELDLTNHDLSEASTEQLTHKQVFKGRRGRRLTMNIQKKILRALTAAIEGKRKYTLDDLFNYRGKS